MGGAAKRFFSDALTIGTMGIVEPEKGRFNVPFSGASARAGAKAVAGSNSDLFSAFTGSTGKINQRRSAINKAIDSPEGRMAGQAAAMASALGTGYGAGAAVPVSAGSTLGAAGAGAAATQINQAETASYEKDKAAEAEREAERTAIADAAEAQRLLEKQKQDALKAAQDARLAVQTQQAEERRRRSGKQAQTVLTGSSGLGGKAPSYTQTLSPGSARKSVLG